MRAITIRQPWAWAILHAGKRVENRGWYTPYRGPLLLHCSSWWKWSEVLDDFRLGVEPMARAAGTPLPGPVSGNMLRAACGHIVGRCNVVGCVRASESPWFCGPWGIVLADVELVPPVRCCGALDLWTPPSDVLTALPKISGPTGSP